MLYRCFSKNSTRPTAVNLHFLLVDVSVIGSSHYEVYKWILIGVTRSFSSRYLVVSDTDMYVLSTILKL